MKALGLVLLALFVGFCGYQWAYPKLDDWAQFANYHQKPAATDGVDPSKAVASSSVTDKLKKSKTEAEMMQEVKPEPPKPEPEMPKPEPVKVAEVKKRVEPEKPKSYLDGFVAPVIPPLEQLTKNWTVIPPSVFANPNIKPKVLKDVEFESIVNGNKITSKVPAGSQVSLVSQEGPALAVSPAPGSALRAIVPLDDTDLKQVLTAAYEAWKPEYIEFMHQKYLAKPKDKPSLLPTGPAKAGEKPEKSPDGTYALLLASMKSGQVTEITPGNIKKWGDAQPEKTGSKEYWTIVVNYTTKTMFGDFDAQGKAWIASGKVEKWTYVGSGEIIP